VNKLLIRSFAGDDEEELLKEFGEIFNHPKLQNVILCAHNGKEFDFPWIARRFLINGMQPPIPFQMFGKNLGKFRILIQWNCGNLEIGKVLFLWN
jgi:DNA polymerase elongation subunit (family B)